MGGSLLGGASMGGRSAFTYWSTFRWSPFRVFPPRPSYSLWKGKRVPLGWKKRGKRGTGRLFDRMTLHRVSRMEVSQSAISSAFPMVAERSSMGIRAGM